jgi:hypothetical protein
MSFDLSPRARLLAIIAVLTVAAAAAGLMTLSRLHHTASPSSAGSTPPAARPVNAPATAHSRPSSARHAGAGAPARTEPGLPAQVVQQLAAGHVVVVSLYDPSTKLDGTATAEASAGAALAHAAFVPVNVTGSEVDGLNRRFGVIQDPAVLVLRPPGDLIVRIDGFADRDTVAQAANNAGS